MKPSMRYHTAKLAQLLHQKKSYHSHLNSVDKIMNKTSTEYMRRSQQLKQLKIRKQQSFNHTQEIRSKQITHLNLLLYNKICKKKIESFQQPLVKMQINITQRQAQKAKKQIITPLKHFVLKNHRQSPIHKSTFLERNRENVRLAKNIVHPNISYRTSKLQQLHLHTKSIKDRIMHYQSSLAMPKAQIYLKKKLSNSSLASDKAHSNKSIFDDKNPQHFRMVEIKTSK